MHILRMSAQHLSRWPAALLISLVVGALVVGCSDHRVTYSPFLKVRIPPTNTASAVNGSIDEAKALFEKAQLPHNSPRAKYELGLQGLAKVTDQLGSPDYVIIGEVYGGGSARATRDSLVRALCKRAAREGGDVVMVFRAGIVEQPYSFTVPGSSMTNSSATAYGYGNYAQAYGTSYTTYTPAQTYSGIMHKPVANGLVLKLSPGVDAKRRRLLELDDRTLASVVASFTAISGNSKLRWSDARSQADAIVDEALSKAASAGGR